MNQDSKWGNLHDHQVKASFSGDYTTEVDVREIRIFDFTIRKAGKKKVTSFSNLSTRRGDLISDEVVADRTFLYRCGLIKAINVFSGGESNMTLYLEGFPNVILDIGRTEFKFDSKLSTDPVVEIFFQESCTRQGKMSKERRNIIGANLIFKNRDQMMEFVVATTTTPDQKQEVVYRSSRSHDSDSNAFWPLVAGAVIGSM